MKKKKTADGDEMLDHYDFSGGVRGKYLGLARRTTQIVVLESDVAETFPDSETVNSALRGLIPAIRNQAEKVIHR